MNITYLEGRLKASLAMVAAAVDPSARFAHQGLAAGYKALLVLRRKPRVPSGHDLDAALADWTNEGGSVARRNAA